MSSSQKKKDRVTVSIIDDSPDVAATITSCLRQLECDTVAYTDPGKFIADFSARPVDIVVTDLFMPGIDGITLMKHVKKNAPHTDVILVTGHADKSVAIQALRSGAHDLLEKPVSAIELVETVRRIVNYRNALKERDALSEQVSILSKRVSKKWGIEAIIGGSKAFAGVLRDIKKVQTAPNTPVLITGESGSGKELVAHAIHAGSARADRPFVPLNCAAVPTELAESILFGHTKGSFTGAIADKKGSFDQADGGTLFLDEIGDMPPAMQTKLLRVLEDGIVSPVGGVNSHHVNTRIIAATNVKIEERLADKRFRTDLFYRLSTYTIKLPPVREHKDDIPPLADHFIKVFSEEMGFAPQTLSPLVLAVLNAHDYPGNVRELKNVIERALIESNGKAIEPQHINFPTPTSRTPAETSRPAGSRKEPDSAGTAVTYDLGQKEKETIQQALTVCNGNVSAAARLLGIERAKLYRKMAAMGK